MKHRLGFGAIALEPRREPLDRHDVAEVAFGDVAPFVARAEPVDDNEIPVPALLIIEFDTENVPPLTSCTPVPTFDNETRSSVVVAPAASVTTPDVA